MAAPIADKIQLPSDAGNTGKKVRTLTRVIGADTVHEHFYVESYPRDIRCVSYLHSGALTVLAAAHAATAGFFWVLNPVGSGINGIVRRMKFSAGPVTALVAPTAPRILAERMTFTGTPSGATVALAARDSAETAPVLTVRSASTGITPVAGNPIRGIIVPAIMSAVGTGVPADIVWEAIDNESELILRPGEGIVVRQADAGTTSDTRRCIVDMTLLEYNP